MTYLPESNTSGDSSDSLLQRKRADILASMQAEARRLRTARSARRTARHSLAATAVIVLGLGTGVWLLSPRTSPLTSPLTSQVPRLQFVAVNPTPAPAPARAVSPSPAASHQLVPHNFLSTVQIIRGTVTVRPLVSPNTVSTVQIVDDDGLLGFLHANGQCASLIRAGGRTELVLQDCPPGTTQSVPR